MDQIGENAVVKQTLMKCFVDRLLFKIGIHCQIDNSDNPYGGE